MLRENGHAPLRGAPYAVRREVREEARASRVRRYANPLPARPTGPGYASAFPSPRRPLDTVPPATPLPVPVDYVPLVHAEDLNPPTDTVRGYYRAHEARQRTREDRNRLGVAVLLDMAKVPA